MSFVLACLFSGGLASAFENIPTPTGPVSPEESLKHLVIPPDLTVELAACEPQVIDPVAIAFDESGRLWVVEMTDYPNGPAPGEQPRSRIRLLKDNDGDGFYETAQTFADALLFANGIQPWRGGVIVTMAGKVEYFKDEDGDGRADLRETWFTGFTEENPQLRANHPTFGLDNQIYVANGLRGGVVIAAREEWKSHAQPVSISGRDFRFDPLTGKYAAISGVGQFGLTFDAFGNRFVCSNRNPCIHVILESDDLARNPHFAVAKVGHDASPAAEASRVFPLVKAWTTSTLHAGQFTAACGVTIYQGDALPQEFRGNSFTCEPTGSLVHRDVLIPQGATFTSKPGQEGVEFLASRDPWFRAVNLANAPDGALYIVDMYRAVIEHPQFMPTELKTRRDLTDGNDKGRIYRIVPKSGVLPQRESPAAIAKLPPEEWVKFLDHPNGWHRETASRLIYESQGINWEAGLRSLVADGKTPEGRVRALWALEGKRKLFPDLLGRALNDPHPRVVEHAVRLSEPWLKGNPQLQDQLKSLADHPDARLRFQVALSLGEAPDQKPVVPLLAKIALQNPQEEWTRAAVLSSVGEHSADLLVAILHQMMLASKAIGDTETLLEEVAGVLGSQNPPDGVRRVLEELATHHAANSQHVEPVLVGLGEGLARSRDSLGRHIQAASKETQEALGATFQNAAKDAASAEQALTRRLAALDLLRFADPELSGPILKDIAKAEANQTLRIQAIGQLARLSDAGIGEMLLKDFRTNSPAVRRAILDCLLANTLRTKTLLEAIAANKLAVNELSPAQVKRLTEHRDQGVQQLAKELLAAAIPADRQEVLKDYQSVLALKADAQAGRAVFIKNCAACHKIGSDGVNVAPDIADSRTREPSALLTDILDPNRAIDNNYFSFTVLTTDGQTLTGIIETETETSITLKQQEAKTISILRSEIEDLKSDGVSLMPVGLEKNITKQQMADLISFIKNWRYIEDNVPIDLQR
jgi:putative membrane-bound dehydrogenase-like protein